MTLFTCLYLCSPFQALLAFFQTLPRLLSDKLAPSNKKWVSISILRPVCITLMAVMMIYLSKFLPFIVIFERDIQQVKLVPDFRFKLNPTQRGKFSRRLFHSPTLEQSRFRAYMSIFPDSASDGIGNGFATINYDFLFAHLLNATYIHRDARYGSLSPDDDPLAIERLFGWDNYTYIRSKVASDICAKLEMRKAPNCKESVGQDFTQSDYSPVCVKLPKSSPFKRIVNIPSQVSDCLINKMTPECKDSIRAFSALHPEEGTLFQLIPDKCGNVYRCPDFRRTGPWFRYMYWKRHEKSTGRVRGEGVTRVLRGFRAKQVQVAVHIRRGDFFMAKNRVLIADGVYADVIATVARITKRMLGEEFSMRVSIFSEGVPMEGESLGHEHDVSRMDSIYVDENQTRHGDGREHWEGLLRERGVEEVVVEMQVGTDTIEAIHGMTCADVFIGSMSSMSRTVVGELARGVVLEATSRELYKHQTSKGHWRIYYVHDEKKGFVNERDVEERLRQVVGGNKS